MRSPQQITTAGYSRSTALALAVDVLLIAGSLWFVLNLAGEDWTPHHTAAVLWAIGPFLVASHLLGAYQTGPGSSPRRAFAPMLWAWFAVALTLLFLAFSTKTTGQYSRRVFLSWFVLAPLTLIVWRGWVQVVLSEMHKRGMHISNVAIVGARELGTLLARTILDEPWMGLNPVGFYDDRKPGGTRPLAQEPIEVIGSLDALVAHAREGRIDIVYITLPMRAEARIHDLIAKLSDTTVSVYLVPDFFMFDLLHASWGNVGELPVVSISESPFYGVDGVVKRIEDVVISLSLLLLLSIPMALIAIGVRLSSPGPIVFRQYRYGLRGNRIEVWKFRTMTTGDNGPVVVQAQKDDPRVTKLGAFLRRTSLDELPQLINVLQGTMSIVGPRPHAVAHNEQYRKLIGRYMLRHKVKPGITGWAQINGWRGETESLDKMQRRVEFDLAYIHNWSLWLDLKIILRTAFVVFGDKNAY
jgi:putative colanic acid biosynthesis UDP-glucose lipid carrier transferase